MGFQLLLHAFDNETVVDNEDFVLRALSRIP